MGEAFEWFDPYEQKEHAERESRRANEGIQTGRRQVEDAIARATREGLSEKMKMAVAGLAENIARRVAFDLGAKRAHHAVSQDLGDRCAKAFREACQDVLHGLELPERSHVRVVVDRELMSREESMTIEYETLRPIQVAYRLRL